MSACRFFLMMAFAISFARQLQSQTVVENDHIELSDALGGDFGFLVYQDAAATDFTGVSFRYSGTRVSLNAINIDESSDWYVVQPGDVFSRAATIDGNFTPIVTPGPTSHPPAFVGDDEFYLGVATSIGDFEKNDRDVFGWVHLRNNADRVEMINNAISYDSVGIIVGTTTTVPEPSTLVGSLFFMAVAMMYRTYC